MAGGGGDAATTGTGSIKIENGTTGSNKKTMKKTIKIENNNGSSSNSNKKTIKIENGTTDQPSEEVDLKQLADDDDQCYVLVLDAVDPSPPPVTVTVTVTATKEDKTIVDATALPPMQPFLLTVEAGQDLLEKLCRFTLEEGKDIIILDASGSLSKVTMTYTSPIKIDEIITHEGRFRINELKGCFFLKENVPHIRVHNRSGRPTIAVQGADGNKLGGYVAGKLVTATRVKVMLGVSEYRHH